MRPTVVFKNLLLRQDANQLKAMERLDKLYDSILDFHLRSQQGWVRPNHCLTLKKLSKLKWFNVTPPKGMYIHGNVGSGKTLVMGNPSH
jgi:predicted ATPase